METKTRKTLLEKFEALKGAKFVGIRTYTSKTSGEIQNATVNVNISVKTAKEKDLETLRKATEKDLENISKQYNLPLDRLQKKLTQMINSRVKNLSPNINDHTDASKAQINNNIHIAPGIIYNKGTDTTTIFGMVEYKEVLKKGEYKKVNKGVDRRCREAIEKYFDLRERKYRKYVFENADTIAITGSTIQIL